MGARSMDADIHRAYIGLPGTGKTTAVQNDLLDELDSGVDIRDVCVSTYRNRMADEFIDRANEQIAAIPDENWIGTTHSTCFGLLELRRENVADEDQRREFCEERLGIKYDSTSRDVDTGVLTGSGNASGNQLFTLRSYCLNTLRDPATEWRGAIDPTRQTDLLSPADKIPRFNREWEAYKAEHGLFDFDDMLTEVRDQGLCPPAEVLIEDEFQDKSPLQVEIFEQWANHADRTYVAGDPFQALYSHLGTDPTYMEAAYETAEESVLLDTSYRFGKTLWETALRFLGRANQRPPGAIEPTGDSAVHTIGRGEYATLARSLADEEAMHLIRCNYLATDIAEMLNDAGVVFKTPRGPRWTATMVDLYNGAVRVASALTSLRSAEFASGVDWSSMTDAELHQLARHLRATRQDGTKAQNIEATDPEDGGADIGPQRVLDIKQLANDWVHTNPFKTDAFPPSAFSNDAIRKRLGQVYAIRDAGLIDGIHHTIQTIHTSKGQEADHVFLYDAISPAVSDGASPFPETDEAEARVWFVGATRARKHLYLVESGKRPAFDFPDT